MSDGGAWAQEAHRRLAAAGYRAGGARQAVIDLLAQEGGCLGAQEIAERLRGAAGQASVYRALAALTELRLVRGRDLGHGVARYELLLASGEHHHHVVCDGCGASDRFDDPELEAALQRVAGRSRFEVSDHDVMLRGLCPDCARRPG